MAGQRIFNKWLASTLLLLLTLHGHSLASPVLGHTSSQHDQNMSNMSWSSPPPAGGQVGVDVHTPTAAPHGPLHTLIYTDDSNTAVIQSVKTESDDDNNTMTQSINSEDSLDEATQPLDGEEFVDSEDSSAAVNQVTESTGILETVISTVDSNVEEEYLLTQAAEEYDPDEWLLENETCSIGVSDENGDTNPTEDTADLKGAYTRILEHVVGGPQQNSDPENMRMRAYVVHRKSHVVTDNLLDQWQRKLVNETTGEMLEDSEGDDSDGEAWEESEDDGDAVRVLKAAVREALESNSSVPRMVQGGGEEAGQATAQITVVEGARLRLVCNVTGVHHYWVEWRREAGLTFPDGSLVVGGRSVLLEYVAREDAGTYVCTARIAQGRTHSSALTIHVHYAPVVGVWARSVGDTGVELGCLVEGRPRPSSAWYINNTRLSVTSCPGDMEARSATLAPTFLLSVVRVANTSVANFAYYHCRATNAVGVSRAYVMVHDNSGLLNLSELKPSEVITYSTTTMDNPRLASFLLGMVPPLYIALYIIAYLSCYKTSISGMGGHGRFGANIDMDNQ